MKNNLCDISLQKKASIAYMLASIMTKGLNYITLPIFTRILSVEDMGCVTTYTTWYTILYVIVTLSVTSGSINVAMVEFYKERSKYQASCLTLSTISALVYTVIYFVFHSIINKVTMLSTSLMVMQIVMFIFNPALDIWYARQRYEYKYKSVVIVSSLSTIMSVIFAIIILQNTKNNTNYDLASIRIISQNSVIAIFGIFFFVSIYTKAKCLFNKRMILFALQTSLPLIVHSLAKNILDASDRLMINKFCGNREAGIYGTVYSISLVALIVWSALNSSIIPYIFENLKCENYVIINKLSLKLLVGFGIVSLSVTLIAPEIIKFLTTSDYYEAIYIIPAITSGIFFTALYGLYGNFLLYKKKTMHIMFATVIATISNLILNYFGIRKYGYTVAAYTTLISFCILAMVQGIMCLCIYKRNIINVKKVCGISVLFVACCLLCNKLYNFLFIRYMILIVFILCMVFIYIRNKKVNY